MMPVLFEELETPFTRRLPMDNSIVQIMTLLTGHTHPEVKSSTHFQVKYQSGLSNHDIYLSTVAAE